jgi:Arc/MetJ-type ribon-helix-helix transcriptional regulator
MENNLNENKERVNAWLPPSMIKNMERLCEPNNFKNKSEFIYNAVDFYIGYLNSRNSSAYLSKILMSALQATLKETELRHANNIFRLSVEMSMMMNILAAGLEISDEDLRKLRGRCVKEVKASRGKICMEDALEYQNGDDSI